VTLQIIANCPPTGAQLPSFRIEGWPSTTAQRRFDKQFAVKSFVINKRQPSPSRDRSEAPPPPIQIKGSGFGATQGRNSAWMDSIVTATRRELVYLPAHLTATFSLWPANSNGKRWYRRLAYKAINMPLTSFLQRDRLPALAFRIVPAGTQVTISGN